MGSSVYHGPMESISFTQDDGSKWSLNSDLELTMLKAAPKANTDQPLFEM